MNAPCFGTATSISMVKTLILPSLIFTTPLNPAFSKAFVLKADNEEEVRQFFDDPLLDFFAERPDICFELRPSGFVYYRQGKRVETEADKITEFFGEAYSVLKAIQERQDRSPSI